MDRIFQMILNRMMGRLINRGISSGFNLVSGGDKTVGEVTPEDRKSAQAARRAGQRAKQAANLARKLMR